MTFIAVSMLLAPSSASAHGACTHHVYRPVVPVYQSVYRPAYQPVYNSYSLGYRPYRVARPGISISIGTAPRYFGPAVRPLPVYRYGRPFGYGRGIRIGF